MRFRRPSNKSAAALLLAAAITLGGCAREVAIRDRNVIFVVADTLRRDALSIHGGSTPTPNLDHLAKLGVRFERAYSHVAVTGPSHASIFTGLLPSEHGALINTDPLPGKLTTLAEILLDRGYHTTAVVSLGVLKSKYGFAQGFTEFDDTFGDNFFRPGDEITAAALDWLAADPQNPFFLWLHYSDPHEPYSPPTETFADIEVWLNSQHLQTISTNGYRQIIELDLQSGENTLVFASPRGEIETDNKLEFHQVRLWGEKVSMTSRGAWLNDEEAANRAVLRLDGSSALPAALTITNHLAQPQSVKLTLLCHEKYTREKARRLYHEETAFLDRQIGKLTAELERLDILHDSILVFTSDHGEGLGDHDLLGHIHQVYDSLLRVPLFVAAPGQLPEDVVVDSPVRHIDILPTLLDLLQIEPPYDLSGASLAPMIFGDSPQVSLPIISGAYRPLARSDLQSLIRFPYKYILDLQTSREELYDLSNDPGELSNLIHEQPEIAAELRQTLQLAGETGRDTTAREEAPELTQEEIDKLEALGYVN